MQNPNQKAVEVLKEKPSVSFKALSQEQKMSAMKKALAKLNNK